MADLDVVVYGATGFTGRQLARWLAERPERVRFAVAGRNEARLRELAATLGDVPVIVADSGDPKSVRAMAERARVVATTAGPYIKVGTPVVDACVAAGTDCVDITGEVPWVRQLVDRYHATAADKGVRIVPFCGFDSVPADLGALLAVTALRERGVACRRVDAVYRMKAGINGGSLATAMELADLPPAEVFDADRLLPGLPSPGKPARDQTRTRFNETHGRWTSPFLMAVINRRVVRRSAALAASWGEPYGDPFDYVEAHAHRTRFKAARATLGMRLGFGLLATGIGRRLARRFGPAPGEGPSDDLMTNGFFETRLAGEGADGSRVDVTMRADGDPGNVNTIRMLGSSALALLDRDALPPRAGVLTPATAFGPALADRLRAAGIEITVA